MEKNVYRYWIPKYFCTFSISLTWESFRGPLLCNNSSKDTLLDLSCLTVTLLPPPNPSCSLGTLGMLTIWSIVVLGICCCFVLATFNTVFFESQFIKYLKWRGLKNNLSSCNCIHLNICFVFTGIHTNTNHRRNLFQPLSVKTRKLKHIIHWRVQDRTMNIHAQIICKKHIP